MSWQNVETASQADEMARKSVNDTAAARRWWDQPIVHAATALDVASASADDASEYWSILLVSWDEAGRQLPIRPEGWDKLAGVWKSAAETTGAALTSAQEQSLRTIIGGALAGSVQDAAELTETTAGTFSELVEGAKSHPILTGGIILTGALLWRAGPEIIGALVSRALR